MNTVQKMASKSSTKQDRVATTEEVPGSVVIYTEEEINTFHRDFKLSVLFLGHFISFSFATKEVKGVNSPLWKRAVAWNRSRRASAYGTVWGDVSKTKTWRNLARNVVVTARF